MSDGFVVRYLAAQILFLAIAVLLLFLRLSGVTPRTQIVDIYDIAFWSSAIVSYVFSILFMRLTRKVEVT